MTKFKKSKTKSKEDFAKFYFISVNETGKTWLKNQIKKSIQKVYLTAILCVGSQIIK